MQNPTYLEELQALYKNYFIREENTEELQADILAGKVTNSFLDSLNLLTCYISEQSERFNQFMSWFEFDLTEQEYLTKKQVLNIKTLTAFYFIQNHSGENFYFSGKTKKQKAKTKKQIIDLYLAGFTHKEISSKLKKSLTHVYNIIREYQAKNE